jgi:septal ring factor EnvC (AmiA/AmiB activator)
MGDTMLIGVLRMPMDNPDPLKLMQFVSRARQAADRIETDAKEIEAMRSENERLREDVAHWKEQHGLAHDLSEWHKSDVERLRSDLETAERALDAQTDFRAEIERLRELVESAYRDGWQDGSVRDPFGNVGSLDDWERSDTKAALAGREE